MHSNEKYLAVKFENHYAKLIDKDIVTVLDVGSLDINGNLRFAFQSPRYDYTGCDIVEGKNVDIVLQHPDNWQDIGQYDIVVCASVIEHVIDIYKFVKNLSSVCKLGGLIWILAPAVAEYHEYPIDCWRMYPEALKFLVSKVANLEVLDVDCVKCFCNEPHTDTIIVAKKIIAGEKT